jgi:hypothetical protein
MCGQMGAPREGSWSEGGGDRRGCLAFIIVRMELEQGLLKELLFGC